MAASPMLTMVPTVKVPNYGPLRWDAVDEVVRGLATFSQLERAQLRQECRYNENCPVALSKRAYTAGLTYKSSCFFRDQYSYLILALLNEDGAWSSFAESVRPKDVVFA